MHLHKRWSFGCFKVRVIVLYGIDDAFRYELFRLIVHKYIESGRNN